MDRGIFFLAATALGAGIGYVTGKAFGDSLPGWEKITGVAHSRLGGGTGTLVGALLGASIAGIYLYVEFLFRAVIWCAEACMDHPIRVLVVTAVFIGAVAIATAIQDKEDKPPKGKRV